jgi:uncharacterized protein YbjT (DUF2867 family)
VGKILVTGASGNVGSEVARLLAEAGHPVRAAARDAERLRSTFPGVDRAVLDFERPETYTAALRDVDRLFLVRPPAISETRRYVDPFVDAARDAGTERIAFLSLLGAEKNPVLPHRRIERHLEVSGFSYTFLRASFFMQNLSTVNRAEIRKRGVLVVPAGRGRTSFVDARDLAAVAAKALTEPGHENRAYPLTGGEALDYFEVTNVLSEVLGTRIVYARPGVPEFVRAARARGLPWGLVAVMVGIYTTARLGLADTVTDDLARILNRPPTTLRKFASDLRETWA